MACKIEQVILVSPFTGLTVMSNAENLSYLFPDLLIEPRHKKTGFLCMRKQRRRSASPRSFRAFVFATRIVQSLYFLILKFQASSHLVWLYSPVCVRPGRKPRRPVFSQRGTIDSENLCSSLLLLFTLSSHQPASKLFLQE